MKQAALDRIRGSICALATPFKGGEVDFDAYRAFVDWQISEGTNALVPCGTTGESPTLDASEHDMVVKACVEVAAGRVPVIAGTGGNCTRTSIERTKAAELAGADAVMLVAPYYNKPTQAGLVAHFTAVANSTDLPVILYNVPARTVTDISVETLAALSKVPNIVGVKDATAKLERVSLQKAACQEGFIQLSGEDPTAVSFNAQGGAGCISVTANVAPALCAAVQSACADGDYARAQNIHDRLMPLHTALFLETSPGPLKYGLSLLGLMAEDLRLPLVAPGPETRKAVKYALANAGLIAS